ncbi:microtubule-associated protein 9-like [Clytia hemisphaerica]|uniref:Uncharacterized protein n=1 Tax=Clytia hemisphaerica TaxID=252671 RepID=A0A7M6DPH1_9CNID
MSRKAVPKHLFTSHDDDDDDDEDEDDIVYSPKPSKPLKIKESRQHSENAYKQHEKQQLNLNDSHGNKSLKSSHERDSFLNAFLDRDANSKPEPLQLKSRHDASKENTPTPKPRPRKDDPNTQSFRPPPQFNFGTKEDTQSGVTKNSLDFESVMKKSVDRYSIEKDGSMKLPKERETEKSFKPVRPSNDYSTFDHKEGSHETKTSKIPQSAQDLIDSMEKYKTQNKSFDVPSKQERPAKSPRTPKSTQELLDSMEKYKHQQSQDFGEAGRPVNKDKPTAASRTPQSAQDLIDSVEKYKSQSKDLDMRPTKTLEQERPTKSPRSQPKSDLYDSVPKQYGADEKARERPTKSPRAPQPSINPIDKYGREKSFEKEKPVKQERPTKSPRPTQPVSKSDIPSRNEEHSKQIKQEKPTNSPRPTKPPNQKLEDHREIIQNKYDKNLSKFDDLLRSGPQQTKTSKEDERQQQRLHEKVKSSKDRGSERQQQEIDDLFDIGGRSSSIKSLSKDDKKEKVKNLEQERNDGKFDRKNTMRDIKSKDSEQANKNLKSRDYKESNKDVNKIQEKSVKPKSGLSRQERFDQESRQKLKDYVINDEDEVKHSKRIPDEQIDSLFDAGSKRTASVRKEKVKNERLKEHVRRSNESLRRTMDEENVGKDKTKRKEDDKRDSTSQKKKGPMKANLPLEEATKSPIPKTKAIKNRPLSSTHRGKSRSLTNISNLISPHSKSPITYDDVSNMDGQTLRHQIYTDWLQRKHSFTKDETKVRKEKEAKDNEDKERLAHERRVDAKKSFDAWGSKKDEVIKNKRREMKKKEQQKKEEEDEKLQKTKEASKFFESWKQQKDEEIKSKKSKAKREENEKTKKEVGEKMEKSEDAKKVFDNWKARKDEKIKDQEREKRKLKKKEETDADLDGIEKKQAAQRSYEAWKERKEKSRPSSANKLQQRAWCPSSRQRGNAIPGAVNPVIVRNKPPSPRTRTLSATARLQNTGKRSK